MYYSVRTAHWGAFLPQGQEVVYKFCTWLGAGGNGTKVYPKNCTEPVAADDAILTNPENEGRQEQCKPPVANLFQNSPVRKVHLKDAYASTCLFKGIH